MKQTSERRIEELTQQLRQQQLAQLTTVKQVSEQVKEQEIQQLKAQFEQVN